MASLSAKSNGSAIKRILADLKELENDPVEGISVGIPDDSNIFELHGNIKIMSGPYEGMLIHTYIHLPQEYPHIGPAMNIARGINFGHTFHEHVMNNPTTGNSICTDMLTNYEFFFKKQVASGWTSGCTLKTLLIQMTLFFADPDLPKHMIPNKTTISNLKNELLSFSCSCGHTTLEPLPPIDSVKKNSSDVNDEPVIVRYARERLACGISRENIIDHDVIICYPVQVNKSKFGKLTFIPFIQPMSYSSYSDAVKSGKQLRTVMGNEYNFLIPLFINQEHFSKCSDLIEANIMNIKYGNDYNGKFDPLAALEVLSLLMNQTMISIFNGSVHDSQNLIEGFCHFYQLLMHFVNTYEVINVELQSEMNSFMNGNTNKSFVPDIGVFMMKIFLAKQDYNEIKRILIGEYFARQVFWMNKDHKLNHSEKNLVTRLSSTFAASSISNKLYMFLYKLFTTVVNDTVLSELNSNYGIPSQELVNEIKAMINNVKTNVPNYTEFAKLANLRDVLSSGEEIFDILNEAVKTSRKQGYTKF